MEQTNQSWTTKSSSNQRITTTNATLIDHLQNLVMWYKFPFFFLNLIFTVFTSRRFFLRCFLNFLFYFFSVLRCFLYICIAFLLSYFALYMFALRTLCIIMALLFAVFLHCFKHNCCIVSCIFALLYASFCISLCFSISLCITLALLCFFFFEWLCELLLYCFVHYFCIASLHSCWITLFSQICLFALSPIQVTAFLSRSENRDAATYPLKLDGECNAVQLCIKVIHCKSEKKQKMLQTWIGSFEDTRKRICTTFLAP
jgi:hypothetical protein